MNTICFTSPTVTSLFRQSWSPLLCEVLETRGPVSETHVLLSPHARKPIPRARLSNLTKELLAKNGLDPALPARLRSDEAREPQAQAPCVCRTARRHFAQSRHGAARPFRERRAGAAHAAHRRGQLTRDHPVYRPSARETTAAQRASRIRAALAEHGPCSARELSERLGMAPRMIQRALEPMLARGEIAKEADMSRPAIP